MAPPPYSLTKKDPSSGCLEPMHAYHDTDAERGGVTKKKYKSGDETTLPAVVGLLFQYAVFIILFLCSATVVLEISPQIGRAVSHVEREILSARGASDASTCRYFRGELTEAERARWEKSALEEGEAKCLEAGIVLKQYPIVMKMRRFVMEVSPFSKENLPYLIQTMTLFVSTISSLAYCYRTITMR